MSLNFKAGILWLLHDFSQSKEKKFLLLLNKNLDISFPAIQGTNVESKVKETLKQISFYKKDERIYLRIEKVEVVLEDIYALVEKYNQILKLSNAEKFIGKIPDKKKTRRDRTLNTLFSDWLKISRIYYKVLALLRGGKHYNEAWARLDFDYFQTTAQMFLEFARGAYIKRPTRIVCPDGTINFNYNIPRFSKIVNDFYSDFENIAKNNKQSYVSINCDETIGKKYFEYAYHLYTGARVCSNTGRFKNFYSRIGVVNKDKKGKEREIRKEIRDDDTLTLIKKIFGYNLFDGRSYEIKETQKIIEWTSSIKEREDLYYYFHSIAWDKRHDKPSALGTFLINIADLSFSVRQEYSHFVLITNNDPKIKLKFN